MATRVQATLKATLKAMLTAMLQATLPLAAAALLAGTAQAQTADLPPLRPFSSTSIEDALTRPPGAPTPAPRTSGTLDLRGRQAYIAEYLLLVDLSGELPVPPRDGKLLGMPLTTDSAVLAYRAPAEIAAWQAVADHAWADLQARLQAAGVALADAQAMVRAHGAVYEATEAASAPGAPVYFTHTQAGTTRRYLVMAPTGMRRVPRTAVGIGLGNLAARVAYPAQRVEGLSLAMALNLGAVDTSGGRPPAFAAPGGLPTLSPLMELAPAPTAALVHAHAQLALVNLGEALVPAAAFGRLRLAPMDGPIPSNDPIKPLFSIGRRLLGETAPAAPKVDALLDLDGPATARLAVYLTGAANQAIADALKAAR